MQALALFLAMAAAMPQPQSGAVVWGRVRSEGTGAPLRYAIIEMVGAGAREHVSVQTDANGYYILRDVPSGTQVLRATHIDHAPLEVRLIVASDAQIYHDFDLALRPLQLPVVHGRARVFADPRPDTGRVASANLGPVSTRVLEATPGVAEFGLAEAAREVPGHEPPDPTDVLFVRGATADLKLILLNGAPVFAPFHIGGLIQALDTDLLRSATLHSGGAPARYDGGLSYVMDMETRTGRGGRPRAEVGVDMLSARGVVEGPIGDNASYMVGGRGVHGLGAEPFIDEAFPYAYGDGLGRFDIELGAGHSVTATGFWNREVIQIDSIGRFDHAARWGNTAGSLRYHGDMAGGEAMVTLGVGEFDTRIPIDGTQPLFTEGRSRRLRFSGDFTRTLSENSRLFFGGTVDRLRFENRVWARGDLPESALVREASGTTTGMYVDAVFNPVERVRLRGGVRADLFSIDFVPRATPRLAASIMLGESATLTLAGGRYRQYVRATDLSQLIVSATVPDEPPPPLKVAASTHYVLSLDQVVGEALNFTIEGYYKAFSGLPEQNGRDEAEASGLDLWVRRGGRVSGWFGYSLAWVWYTPEERPFAPGRSFAGRHLVSAGVSGPVVGNGSFDIRVAYGSGLPYTAIPEPDLSTPVLGVAFRPTTDPAPDGTARPDDPYLRLDAQVQRTWQGDMLGVAFAVTPYVKVLNALDRRDALFYHLETTETGTDLRALASLPVLPVLGVEWRF